MSDIDIGTIRNDKNLKPFFYNDKCDKYDYLIAVGCGAIAGLVDIFLVGSPTDSKLQSWTDEQVDKTVMAFAKTCGWKPREGKENSVASAISFLERKFPVNYDQRHTGDINKAVMDFAKTRGWKPGEGEKNSVADAICFLEGKLSENYDQRKIRDINALLKFKMSAKNHHMKSLAHSPDIIGLFFSILNQFTSTSAFLSDGKLITIKTQTFELQGHDFISKLFCGITNWFGHIMSDIAGSSGSTGRGSGIVIPFYELFQLCDFGSFQVDKNRNTLATVATKVFQEGYDARFGLTMAIPVVICDLSIKLIWAIKHCFYHKRPLNECVPTKRHDDLRIMLIIGDGTLCLMDGADAAVRSGGNWVNFFLRLNIIAWYRLVFLSFREVCIRLGISFPLQKQLDTYIKINEALTLYLTQLEKIDIELFKKETEQYNQMLNIMETTNSEYELNTFLKNEYKRLGIELPYSGTFDDFMNDSSSVLEFK